MYYKNSFSYFYCVQFLDYFYCVQFLDLFCLWIFAIHLSQTYYPFRGCLLGKCIKEALRYYIFLENTTIYIF